jgi:hypothetical protein
MGKGWCEMFRKLIPVLVAGLLVSQTAPTTESWEKKPFMEWSAEEVSAVLNNSPWVALYGFESSLRSVRSGPEVPAGVPSGADGIGSLPRTDQRTYKTAYFYCFRLLTAKPVREAILRSISLGRALGPVASLKDLSTTGPTIESERLRSFIASRPNDLIVRGSNQYIVVALSCRVGTAASTFDPILRDWREITIPAQFSGISLPDLQSNTFLSTDAGGRAAVVRFEPRDRLGARYYFPKTLADGTPLIGVRSQELRFQTSIQGKQINVKFDLKKMNYRGTIEL